MDYLPTTESVVEADTGGSPPKGNNGRGREIVVLFTTHAGTVAALKVALRLSGNLGARPQVLMLYEVPYTLPLEKRALPEGFLENQVRALQRDFPEEISLRICLCRHPRETLHQVLPPHSLIVMGGKKRWWPSREEWLARMLKKEGHEVVFAELR